ncbi:unnamed protein product [Heterobilharzia americana]|nr:unnamed protein product [Heterobilharzia americana]CAH8580392.1 unnamed protein product [Heterobilharzia americana]
MSSELNKTEQYSQIDQPIKEDSIENDYKIKSDTTYPLLCNTLIDSDCKKMKLSDVWETSNTPPLESTLTLNQEISSEMNPKDKDIIEYEQSDTVHDVHHDDEIYKDKTKKSSFTNVKDESNYRITDNYETYHTNIEKDICTEFDNPMYIPIKLPLSSNLYVPVYYVQSSEEALPKADKHHVDYYHSNNNNNNDNISESNNIHDNNSTVSQNFPLKSNSSLRGNDIPSNLQSDYHINTSNQGYQNSISPYYTTEVSPNHHDLDKCELKIKSKQTKIRLKPSQKTKSKMKNFIQVKNKNITIKSSNHNDEGIKEVEATTIGKINNIDKRKRYTGCSPKLKFKKTKDNTEHVKKGKQEKKKSKNNQIQKEVISANEDKTEIQSKSKAQKNERKEAKNQRKILCATTRKTQKTKNQNPEETPTTKITEKKQPNAQKTPLKPKKTNKHGDEATKQKIGLTGQVSAPDVDVSVPSKKFTFGWGSKGKKAKKVKVPKVSGDVDAGLDVSGKVDVPSVDVDVDAGGRGKGKKFHWSPNISLPKFNVHMPDVSGKVHADAPDVSVSGTGPSVELPSVKASARLPTVDVSVPDASLGGDLSGKLDLDGTGLKILNGDLNISEAFAVECFDGRFSGFDSGSPLDVPDLLTDFSDSSVGYFGAGDLFPVSRCSVDYGIVADEPVIAPVSARAEFSSEVFDSRLSPLYAFQDINETFSSPLDSGFNGDASYDDAMSADIDEIFIVPIHYSRVLPTFDASSQSATFENSADLQDFPAKSSGNISPVNRDTDMMHEALPSLKSPKTSFWPLSRKQKDSKVHRARLADAKKQKVHDSKPYDNSCPMNNTSVPRKISHPDHNQGLDFDSKNVGGENSSCLLVKQNHSKEYFDDHHGGVAICSSNFNDNLTSTPRRSPNKSRDPSIRKTWHGPREPYSDLTENNYPEEHEFTFTEEISDIHLKPMKITRNENNKSPNVSDFLRRSIVNTSKRRPWSTLEYPPPGCKFVDDDYLFPDALTPTKIPSFRASKEIVYDVPYMDDKALPTYEPEWPLGESRRTLISQLSQNSNSLIRITAEEESSLISLDTKLSDQQQHGSKRKNRFKANKKSTSTQDDLKIRSKSGNKFLTWWSKHGSPHK